MVIVAETRENWAELPELSEYNNYEYSTAFRMQVTYNLQPYLAFLS